jgi:hypothetical protein
MERLVIRSFLDHGHPFHLYVYGDVENVPAGTIVRPGTEILPEDQVFCYQSGYGKGSFSGFSNWFRYKLLLERGGWWADLDAVCSQPLDFAEEHVLGYERRLKGGVHVACGLVKAPPGSPLIEYCWQRAREVDRDKVRWGQIGPRLMARAISTVKVPMRILDPPGFYPVDWWDVWRLVRSRKMPQDCYSIHLWNSQWRRAGFCPDAVYTPECIYEQLKRRHGIASPPGALRGNPGCWRLVRHLAWRTELWFAKRIGLDL